MEFLLTPLIVLGIFGALLGIGLGFASKKFSVNVDSRIEQIASVLPGANCGACGFPGCANYARAIVDTGAKTNLCPAGGMAVAEKIAGILGVSPASSMPMVAKIHCNGSLAEPWQRGRYDGVPLCSAAAAVSGGTVLCAYGCLGFGDCERTCPFGAITSRAERPPAIDPQKCVGCGLCVASCPRNLIQLLPAAQPHYVACASHDKGKAVRSVCEKGCIACGLCVKKHPDAFRMEENLARAVERLDLDNGEEIQKVCPTGCIQWTKSEK
ncbi:RnfABCDGE-type electron transport complex B subunit [Hydrogenispora ethanolica]|jgi:Na+-translocating ferredoxin:NAD+ oxidoreductase RNF subunit RnfB|uniref:Ion-translocating oxidoreductase complex subunit B n=1 Tax=Hydrogenispora ethanolica TaxID=1082276 RepID=A0A4R1S2C9_HYDET|nr:RnfABCDGE type electron transport complex subunit B [Hydrogenispora ethanolica]TCL73169.1 RnfABCDGE-type electron transport complex B subunit [Hydrogenispora ethanolica]